MRWPENHCSSPVSLLQGHYRGPTMDRRAVTGPLWGRYRGPCPNLRRNFSSGRPTVCLVAVFTVRSATQPKQSPWEWAEWASTHQSRRETRTRARDEPTVCRCCPLFPAASPQLHPLNGRPRSLTGAHDTETSPGSTASDGADVRAGRCAAILGRTGRFFLFFSSTTEPTLWNPVSNPSPGAVPRRHGYRQPSATEIVVRRPIALVRFLVSILCVFLPCPAV